MAGYKRKRVPLQSNSIPQRSIRHPSEMNPNPLWWQMTLPTPPSTTNTAAKSMDFVGDELTLTLAPPGAPPGNRPSPTNTAATSMDFVGDELTLTLAPPRDRPSPTNTAATSMDFVGDELTRTRSTVSGPLDNHNHPPQPSKRGQPKSKYPAGFIPIFGKLYPIPVAASAVSNPPQPPAPGRPSAGRVRPPRNGTALDPNAVGVCQNKGLWESNLWIPGVHIPGRSKKGVQIFLGHYTTKQNAQDAHDRVSLKLLETKGVESGPLNFRESDHAAFMEEYKDWNFRDFVWQFRRNSVRFSTGQSSIKGVTKRTGNGLSFEAKTAYTYSQGVNDSGKNSKVMYYLGKFESEEEAGRAYDRALLFLHHEKTEEQKLNVVTNFRPSNYSESEIMRAGKDYNIHKLGSKPSQIA